MWCRPLAYCRVGGALRLVPSSSMVSCFRLYSRLDTARPKSSILCIAEWWRPQGSALTRLIGRPVSSIRIFCIFLEVVFFRLVSGPHRQIGRSYYCTLFPLLCEIACELSIFCIWQFHVPWLARMYFLWIFLQHHLLKLRIRRIHPVI